ncbi:ABC transporter ATP-binding protein [Vallitalea pronyensis]|nr:ABC transporter ATP-binding protein [Vallitalea pronyensis]
MVILRVLFDKIIHAMIPSLQVLATASFIDTSIKVYNGQAEKSQIALPIISIILLISYEYLMALTGLVREKLSIKLTETFRTAVAEKRAKLEYYHVEYNDTWELIERVGKNTTEWLNSGFDNLTDIGKIFIRIGSVLTILVVQVWWAALLIVTFSIPLFWLAIRSGKANYKASIEAKKHTRRADYLQDLLSGRENVEERALFDYSAEINKRYKEKYFKAYNIDFITQRHYFVKMRGSGIITTVVSIFIAGVLISPLASGEITIGMFTSIISAAFGLVRMMSLELINTTSNLAKSHEYMHDLSAFSNLSETLGAFDLPSDNVQEPKCIEFSNVSFAYPGTDLVILKNLNLKLFAKKHYAFVGVNGAGKSTLIKLLVGLYDNYTGDILIDGKNLRDFSQGELKALFSIVYQDFAKYQISIKDSIGIGNIQGVSIQKIMDVINILGLNDVISKLPEGLNTPLGRIKDRGVDLSGGEWQRVAIARSLISRSTVHILDEPTAALDPVAESEIYELFDKISKDKSTIFITHRLGAARIADEIFVIADGHVTEHGTHEELLNKGGIYAEMFESQRGWYA